MGEKLEAHLSVHAVYHNLATCLLKKKKDEKKHLNYTVLFVNKISGHVLSL